MNTVTSRDIISLDRENPKPLTLDELMDMYGEPVYLQFGTGFQCWAIVCVEGEYLYFYGPEVEGEVEYEDPDKDFYNMEYRDPCGHYGLHALGWRAYRNKPKEAGQ